MKSSLLIAFIFCITASAEKYLDYHTKKFELVSSEHVRTARSNSQNGPIQPIRTFITVKPKTSSDFQCPIGLISNGTACISIDECPEGYELRNGRCTNRIISCPTGQEADHTGQCVTKQTVCASGFKWNGFRCVVDNIECSPGYVLSGSKCVPQNCPQGFEMGAFGDCVHVKRDCAFGFTLTSDGCKPESESLRSNLHETRIVATTSPPLTASKEAIRFAPNVIAPNIIAPNIIKVQPTRPQIQFTKFQPEFADFNRNIASSTRVVTEIHCPPGFFLSNGKCHKFPIAVQSIKCSEGFELRENLCHEIAVQVQPEKSTCPPDSTFENNLCYRCPDNTKLFQGKCIRSTWTKKISQNGVSVNVDLNDTNAESPEISSNIINRVKSYQQFTVNINNVTNPATLNNINKNRIKIQQIFRCPEGSIKSVTVKNKETHNKCIDVNKNSNAESENCCEIMTPRRCRMRSGNQWSCSHHRRRSCGNFCLTNRMYLEPSHTQFSNQILTIPPHQSFGGVNSCSWKGCSGFDCSGCAGGSFNCAPQCYTYPCQNGGCHFLNQDDFCSTVGGSICEYR